MKKDFYKILGIDDTASAQEIKKAYRTKALKYHPDRNPNNKAAEDKFKEINEANDTLSDPVKKQKYDRGENTLFGSGEYTYGNPFSGNFNNDIYEILNNMKTSFNSSPFTQNFNKNQRGQDKDIILEIEFNEAVFGCKKDIKIQKNKECEICQGSGNEPTSPLVDCQICHGSGILNINYNGFFVDKECEYCKGIGRISKNKCTKCNGLGQILYDKLIVVNIPAGVNTNTKLRMTNEGELNIGTNLFGDLYIHIIVRPHLIFQRKNYNLYYVEEIDIFKAILGGKIKIPLLNNEKSGYMLTIPPGTQYGTSFKLKNQGVQFINGLTKGDLFVNIKIKIPTDLSDDQKELLKTISLNSTQ